MNLRDSNKSNKIKLHVAVSRHVCSNYKWSDTYLKTLYIYKLCSCGRKNLSKTWKFCNNPKKIGQFLSGKTSSKLVTNHPQTDHYRPSATLVIHPQVTTSSVVSYFSVLRRPRIYRVWHRFDLDSGDICVSLNLQSFKSSKLHLSRTTHPWRLGGHFKFSPII